jgi:CheY-like chemotaxis protein
VPTHEPYYSWLLVEDTDDDYLLFRRACCRAFDRQPTLRRESDGLAAIEFLAGGADPPSLIVSDLKMPRLSGLELLKWVRGQPSVAQLPFVILSSSNAPQDREAAREAGADDFLIWCSW